MPLAAEDVLQKLIEAIDEAKSTIRELHEARGASMDIIKKQKKDIADKIQKEVETEVKKITDDIRRQSIEAVEKIMNDIQHDWRVKLGLATDD